MWLLQVRNNSYRSLPYRKCGLTKQNALVSLGLKGAARLQGLDGGTGRGRQRKGKGIMGFVPGRAAAHAVSGLALPVAILAAGVIVGGCAALGLGGLSKDSPAAEKQAAVGKRAEERWQALIRGDFEAAYGFYTPASRETVRARDFAIRMSNFPYRSVRVERVDCEDEVCTVVLAVTYDNPAMKMKNVPTVQEEKWIIERGQAWLVFRG
jgi:hypothetical protein